MARFVLAAATNNNETHIHTQKKYDIGSREEMAFSSQNIYDFPFLFIKCQTQDMNSIFMAL